MFECVEVVVQAVESKVAYVDSRVVCSATLQVDVTACTTPARVTGCMRRELTLVHSHTDWAYYTCDLSVGRYRCSFIGLLRLTNCIEQWEHVKFNSKEMNRKTRIELVSWWTIDQKQNEQYSRCILDCMLVITLPTVVKIPLTLADVGVMNYGG